MSGISVSKTGLVTATSNFASIYGTVTTQIKSVRESLETIEANWTGPEHDAASADKTNAEENMTKAESTISSMNGAIAQLSANAGKISYNG